MVWWMSLQGTLIHLDCYPIIKVNKSEITFRDINGATCFVTQYNTNYEATKDFESIKELLLNAKTS